VRTYGARSFPFQDLTVVIRREWIVAFCEEILRRGLDVRWQLPSGTRCEVIDDEVAALLAKSGCGSLAYAPESGSDEIRKRVRKRMKRESLMSAVDAAVRHGLNLTCFVVLGFPEDERRQIRENLPFVRELARRGVDDVACGFFFPIPGTELYDQLVASGRIAPSDDLLLAPLLSHDRYLTEDRNFCVAVPAWRLTLFRLEILLHFYLVSFATRPGRVFRVLANVLRGREESKREAFLAIQRARVSRRLARFRRRRDPALADRAA
jgi:anaerobic magnesium-protoporphyrin IX monomethyl ester cyclase